MFFFSEFFRILNKKFSDFWPKNFKKLSKLHSACADEQFLAWKIFQKFSSALDFLQKPLAWCSNFYLRVHSKNSGRNDFFNLLFIIFSDFERIFFRLSAKKLQVFKLTFYVSRGTRCGLNFFKKNWIVLDFLQKPLAWFSKFYPCVQSKNCGRNVCFVLLFRNFSEFERNVFRLLDRKLQEVDKTTLCVFRRTIFGLKFFSKVLSRFGFSSENLAWFSNFYLRVQRKNFGRNNFFILLFRFFSEFERNFFSDFWPKNFKKLSKLTSVFADEQFLAWNFFQKFWTVLDFLQKPLAWCSNFYLRVHIKNSGRNDFFNLLFIIFSDFERIFFRLSAKKLHEVVKTTFRVCGWTSFGLGIFLKYFEPFWIFCRNLWHGSQNSIYVSRVKIAEEMVFLTFFSEFFSNFEQKFFRLLAKKLQEVDKTTLCVFRRTIFGLNFFSKVLSRFGFSSENLAWFSNF